MNYIVNTTFIVNPELHDSWYRDIVNDFLPKLKLDEEHKNIVFTRIMSQNGEQHFTYSIQIYIDEIRQYNAEYKESATKKLGTEIMYFTSVMKVLEA